MHDSRQANKDENKAEFQNGHIGGKENLIIKPGSCLLGSGSESGRVIG